MENKVNYKASNKFCLSSFIYGDTKETQKIRQNPKNGVVIL